MEAAVSVVICQIKTETSFDIWKKQLPLHRNRKKVFTIAQVAELVDALVSGASGFAIVQVRVLFWAHRLEKAIPVLFGLAFFIVKDNCFDIPDAYLMFLKTFPLDRKV